MFLIPREYVCLIVCVFLVPFMSTDHARTFNLCKTIPMSIWCRMTLTQIRTHVYKDSLTLIYRPNVSIWLVLQVWDVWVGSLKSSILMLSIDTHTFTYIPGLTSVWTLHNIWWTSCEPWQLTLNLIQWSKVCKCYSSIFLDRTTTFEWCVVRYGSKNTHHKRKRVLKRLPYVFKCY
jgi:hypothetical protein